MGWKVERVHILQVLIFNSPLITKSQFHFIEMVLLGNQEIWNLFLALLLIRYVILDKSFNLFESWLLSLHKNEKLHKSPLQFKLYSFLYFSHIISKIFSSSFLEHGIQMIKNAMFFLSSLKSNI